MREDQLPVIRDQLRAYPNPVSVQVMMVDYTFDSALTRRVVGGEAMVEIGRSDAGMPLVLSEKDGRLFILENGQPRFVNTNFPKFLQAAACFREMASGWTDDTSDQECLSEFDTRLSSVDAEALKDPSSFWFRMRDEIALGSP